MSRKMPFAQDTVLCTTQTTRIIISAVEHQAAALWIDIYIYIYMYVYLMAYALPPTLDWGSVSTVSILKAADFMV